MTGIVPKGLMNCKFRTFLFYFSIMFKAFYLVLILSLVSACFLNFNAKTPGKEVVMDRKGLTSVPFEIFSDSTITKLSLFGNKIDFIDDEIAQLTSLEVLFLGKNKFKSFPKALCKLKNLRILSLQHNQIDSIPDCICQLKKLEQLIINNNRLVYISDSLSELNNLEQLNLARNSLRSLPENLTDVHSLYAMDLSFNNLAKLPDSMQEWRDLRDLNLHYAGALLQVPESACSLRFLERIKADPSIVFPACFLTQQTNRLIIYIEP